MASTTLTPHGLRTGGGRAVQNTVLRMSTSTKIIVGIVIAVVMALTSFWGCLRTFLFGSLYAARPDDGG